jgi:alkylation response protein AidB-like acyl-CoA dehydrogenase
VDVTFSDVRARLIGEENMGRQYFEKVSPEMNAAAAAMNAGILHGVYNEALAYSQKREQGGRPIVNWSEIGMMLASISVKADVAAMCVHQSCMELEQKNRGYEPRVSAAALHVAELTCDATSDGIQSLGGYGYMKDYGQEKRYRDARMVQALLGAVPFKKLDIIRQVTNANPNNV